MCMSKKRGIVKRVSFTKDYLEKFFIIKNRRGQIWVETVIYTLIAFTLIGLVLAFAKPRIDEIQDQATIEQSVSILEDIDFVIKTLGGPGNQRVVDLGIDKGTLTIDGENDVLTFLIESRYEYSEPGEDVIIGVVTARTESLGSLNEITLTVDYDGRYDITNNGLDNIETLSGAPTPYRVSVSNEGQSSGETIIDMEVIS